MKPPVLPVVRNLLKTDMGRRHPMQVLARFGFLQLSRRLRATPFSFTTVTGTRALVDPQGDFSGITNVYYLQLPAVDELAFACHCLRPGAVFWDVGANQGFWSLLLAGRGAEAHAFEPAPLTFANQTRQFEAQSSPFRERLHGYNVGLAARKGVMRLTTDLGSGNFLLEDGQDYPGTFATVEVTTADAFRSAAPAPHLIKIDVEGWTLPVLEGANETLSDPRLRALVIETFRHTDGSKPEVRNAEALLARHGFHPFSYDARARALRPLVGITEGRDDTIYVRDLQDVTARVTSAAPVNCFDERL